VYVVFFFSAGRKGGDEVMPNVERCKQIFTFAGHGLAWMAVHGNLQLALRHPRNTGPSREIMVEFVERLGVALVDWGILSEAELELSKRVEREAMK
jgi:hypothetical protein